MHKMTDTRPVPVSYSQLRLGLLLMIVGGSATHAVAETSAAEIAKKLNNPVAAMISVPFQFNYDEDLGPTEDGKRTLLNIQPVIPFHLNETWNLISRTIAPVIKLEDVPPGNDEQGLGDITQSLFLSPKDPTASGWIWGVGPALLLKTASDDVLGTGKWAAGPTAVVLKQEHGWTYGALTNHLWSYAGEGDRTDVDATFLQPFVAFTTSKYTTFTLNTESSYDWEDNEWSVPVNAMVTQVFKIGSQPMSIQFGARYWADTPEEQGPEGWGWRLAYTLVFPQK
jgi:hypothetical protein